MARTEARIKCEIWDDEDFRSLTWEAQWLYKTLLTQKDLSLCGVLTWTPKRFAKLASNASAAPVKKALELLREKRYVVLDDDTDELLVRTLVKGDGVLSNHNSIIGMSKAFEAIHSNPIREAIVQEVIKGIEQGLAIGGPEGGTPTGWVKGLPDHIRKRVGQPFVKALALASARPPPHPPVPPASCLLPPASPDVDPSPRLTTVLAAPPIGESEKDRPQGQPPPPTVPSDPLLERLLSAWPPNRRGGVMPTAGQVLHEARRWLDDRLIDEVIGHMLGMNPPPSTPRYLLVVAPDWAQQRGAQLSSSALDSMAAASKSPSERAAS
jgi:hypothetical protein